MATTPIRLRAGIHVVHRDDDHLQVGVDPPARVIVRHAPGVLAVLEALDQGRQPDLRAPEATPVVRQLADAGLLEPDAHPGTEPASGTVGVLDRGLGLAHLGDLLHGSGVRVAADGDTPDVHLVGSVGPLRRATLDPWLDEGAPHLVLAGTGWPRRLRLGPFVEPGVTACLRCVDAHEATHDPRRPLVVEQLAARPAAPPDPRLVAWALAWAVREVVAFVSGRRPLTWSASIDLDADPARAPEVRQWKRHPYCGCAWDVLPY